MKNDTVRQDNSAQVQPPTVRSGMQIPYFRKGSDTPSIGDSEFMNLILATCNALLACNQIRFTERSAVINIPTGGKAVSDYAGVYVPGQTYNTDEWVVIQAGPGQGAYISTADGNTNDPRTGINWTQFSSLNQWF